jgi:hypothetical protein
VKIGLKITRDRGQFKLGKHEFELKQQA